MLILCVFQESSWSPTSSSSAHSSGLSADVGGGGGTSSTGNVWADGSSDIHTIHTFVRKARANKGKSIRRMHSDSTLLDKMRLKDSLYESPAGTKAERKKDKKLKKLSLGSAISAADSGSSESEKRARIKRSKNSKQPKAKKLKSSAQSETDSESRHGEVRPIREELAMHRTSGGGGAPTLGKSPQEESIRDAEMSSSEGETWIADEDIMVESGTSGAAASRATADVICLISRRFSFFSQRRRRLVGLDHLLLREAVRRAADDRVQPVRHLGAPVLRQDQEVQRSGRLLLPQVQGRAAVGE